MPRLWVERGRPGGDWQFAGAWKPDIVGGRSETAFVVEDDISGRGSCCGLPSILSAVLRRGTVRGAARNRHISLVARADYAAAAAAVLPSSANQVARVYELAGDRACILADRSTESARQSSRRVDDQDLAETADKAALQATGVSEEVAARYAESDVKTAEGALHNEGRQLSLLIDRLTTTMAQSVPAALAPVPSTDGGLA